jgi:hypothetical protein
MCLNALRQILFGPAGRPGSARRLLIVIPDGHLRGALTVLFEMNGFLVTAAATLQESANEFDATVIDLRACDAQHELRLLQMPRHKVLVLTYDPQCSERLLGAGLTPRILCGPFDFESLLVEVRRCVG